MMMQVVREYENSDDEELPECSEIGSRMRLESVSQSDLKSNLPPRATS